ncbi:MAG: hypothetical protein IPP09_05485 [Elusimicrobia bacterium]|nr:hypothetical protein [Elusimicrobiota bacterium]
MSGGVAVSAAMMEQPGVTPVHAHNVVINAMPEKPVYSLTDAMTNRRHNWAVGTMEDPTYHLIAGQGDSPVVGYRVTAEERSSKGW